MTARDLGWQASLPVVALLLAQCGLYAWMVPRGFEFTDEAFYFLNFLYWDRLVGTVTFFGAYFELPFRLLGQSVPGIRVFSLVLLLASSAFFSREVFRHVALRDGEAGDTPWPFVLVSMAASLLYFGFLGSLRAPSYNLLALCSMLVATASLLRLLEQDAPRAKARAAMFGYGLALGACGLGKASSGALLVVCHALYFLLANRDWRPQHLLEILTLSLAGVGLNFAVLQWVHPQWLAVLSEGVALASIIDGRSLPGLAYAFWRDILALPRMLLLLALCSAIVFVLLARWIGSSRRVALSLLVLVLVVGCALGLMMEKLSREWLLVVGTSLLLLWSVGKVADRSRWMAWADTKDLGLLGLLLVLPIVFSFGTTASLLEHSQKAGVFAVTGLCLMLHRLSRRGLLAPAALVMCLSTLCLPTLLLQLRSAWDVGHTYRLLTALNRQSEPVRIGATESGLLVDATTRQTLQTLRDAAHAAGFASGDAILDFSGDGPGLVYALGGRPLGMAWLLGGYPGSRPAAARLVAQLSLQDLRSSWLISSDNNPRAIDNWQQLLTARLGEGSHELAAEIQIQAPYRWALNSPQQLSVQLWKPRAATLQGTAGLPKQFQAPNTSVKDDGPTATPSSYKVHGTTYVPSAAEAVNDVSS